eukprot:UN05820
MINKVNSKIFRAILKKSFRLKMMVSSEYSSLLLASFYQSPMFFTFPVE